MAPRIAPRSIVDVTLLFALLSGVSAVRADILFWPARLDFYTGPSAEAAEIADLNGDPALDVAAPGWRMHRQRGGPVPVDHSEPGPGRGDDPIRAASGGPGRGAACGRSWSCDRDRESPPGHPGQTRRPTRQSAPVRALNFTLDLSLALW